MTCLAYLKQLNYIQTIPVSGVEVVVVEVGGGRVRSRCWSGMSRWGPPFVERGGVMSGSWHLRWVVTIARECGGGGCRVAEISRYFLGC